MYRAKRHLISCGLPLLVGLTAMICSCSDNDPSRPKADVEPTYDNIWPASVGRYWEFDAETLAFDQGLSIYEQMEDVPPIPPMEDLYTDLQARSAGAVMDSSAGIYSLEFALDVTSSRDSVVMVIEAGMEYVEGYAWPPSPLGITFDPEIPWIWTRTDGRIATYSENGTSWLFLEGPFTPGNEFETFLHEDLEGEISLKTRVWRTGPIDLPGESYPTAVECFYVLDAGYLTATGPGGEITGVSRSYAYGTIVYVPEIGPVYYKEKYLGPGSLLKRSVELRGYSLSGRYLTARALSQPNIPSGPQMAH